jgi:hypothetical protein
MIKSVGFGKKRIGMSHEECVKYHIEKHAPFGRRVAGPLGLSKYIGYYPDKALSLDGKVLPELPWDLIVPEWYTDEFWKGLEAWRTTNPDGIEATKDEARFCDRKSGIMMLCQENVIVSPGEDSTGVHVVFLITKKSDMSHEECVKYHKENHAPMVASALGGRLKSYTAYYVDQAFNLEEGLVPVRLYDAVVLARFDDEFWKGMAVWRKAPEGIKITKDEERFIDRKSAIALVCQVSVFIP